MSRRPRVLVAVIAAAAVVAGCGIPMDNSPVAIDRELPTPLPATPTPEGPTTEDFPVYLADANNRMQTAIREIATANGNVTISAIVSELAEEPTEEERALGWRSLVPAETMFTPPAEGARNPFHEDGVAHLDFVSGSLDTLAREELTLALAQLVWTLTLSTDDIDALIIRIDSTDKSWPTDGEDSAVGAPLTFEDYDEFSPDFVEPTPTPTITGGEGTDPPTEGDVVPTPEAPTPGDDSGAGGAPPGDD